MSCSHFSSSDTSLDSGRKPPRPETIARADQLFTQRTDLAKLREVLDVLSQTRSLNQRTYDVEWRFARANYFLGRHTEEEKERNKAFEDGKTAAQTAMRMEPNKVEGFFWFGANLGEQAERSPVMVGLASVTDIRDAMTKVVELQPDYELASAYDVLGRLELDTDYLGGTPQNEVEYIQKSIDLEKNNGDARVDLAEAYLALKKDAEAKKQLEYVLQMKPYPEYLLEYNEQVARAKQLLKSRF